jgi:hypothetical protein
MIDMPAPEAAAGGAMEFPLPSALLALDGAEPMEGDEVEFTVKGTVVRSAGGKAFVKPTEVNGQPLPEMPAAMTEDSVREAAEDADEEAYTT